ncbi:putative Polycomb group protein ASXL2 [Littorina saxatilis]|uniref:DEUBAD domain-containing protein n=1 Tax=Littorina saxatilis TaxID=31220 RepID=A0AAN9B6A9_9CAEN
MASQANPMESGDAGAATASRRSARQSLRTKKYKFDPSDFKFKAKPKASKPAVTTVAAAPKDNTGQSGDTTPATTSTASAPPAEKVTSNGPSKAVVNVAKALTSIAKAVTSAAKAVNAGGSPGGSGVKTNAVVAVGGRPKRSLRELLSPNARNMLSMKPRRRTNKRAISVAAQIEQTKEGTIDLSPNSFLGKINLKNLLNNKTFGMLPAEYQYKLIKLLPECDQLSLTDNGLRASPTALNNEFFGKACQEWKDRLVEGEFTPENQLRLKAEEEKEQKELDPWKAKHFEPVWGQRNLSDVPKATDLSQAKQTDVSAAPASPGPIKVKVKPPNRQSTLVSAMLRQRAVARSLSADTGPPLPAVTQKPLSTAASTSVTSQVGLLATVSQPVGQRAVTVTTSSIAAHPPTGIVIYRTPDGNMRSRSTDSRLEVTGGPSPPKKQRVALGQPTQAAARTLAQIRAQTQLARQGRAPPSVTVVQTVAGSVGMTVSGGVSVMSGHPAGLVPANIVIKPQGRTRTLAEIKAQTIAARAQSGSTSPNASPISSPAMRSLLSSDAGSLKMQLQPKTLASIKAITQARTAQAQTVAVDSARGGAKHQPNIVRCRVAQKGAAGSVVPAEPSGVNLTRSQQICQAELEKSLAGRLTPGNVTETSGSSSTTTPPSPSQPAQTSASKILFTHSPRASPSPVSMDALSSGSRTPELQHTFIPPASPVLGIGRSGTPTKIITVSRGASPGLTKILSVPGSPGAVSNAGNAGLDSTTSKIILVPSSNSGPQLTTATQGGKVVLMTTSGVASGMIGSQPVTFSTSGGGLVTIPASSGGVLTVPASGGAPKNSSHGSMRYITQEALRAFLNNTAPSRAASAPPNNVVCESRTASVESAPVLVRSASVGSTGTPAHHPASSPSPLPNLHIVVNNASVGRAVNGPVVTAAKAGHPAAGRDSASLNASTASVTAHGDSGPVPPASANNQDQSNHFLSKAGTATQVGRNSGAHSTGVPTVMVVSSALLRPVSAPVTCTAGSNAVHLHSTQSPKGSQTGSAAAALRAQSLGSAPLVGVGVVGHQAGGSAAANNLSSIQSFNIAVGNNVSAGTATNLTGLLSVSATVAVTPAGNSLPGIHVLAGQTGDHTVVLPQAGRNGGVIGLGSSEVGQSCMCNHKAMVMCMQCGAFCHELCTGPSKLCVKCLVRTPT